MENIIGSRYELIEETGYTIYIVTLNYVDDSI